MASSNRVVIVTGASQGIGKAVSLHLVSQGVSVVGIARSAPALHGVSQEARQRHAGAGSQFIPVIGTIADESTQQRAVDLATEHGTLVALINNAATADPLKPLASASLAALETHYKVNLVAPVGLIQKTLPYLRPISGRIINLSSVASQIPTYYYAAYGSAKSAINYITSVLAIEEPSVITVAIHPGVVETPMFSNAVGYLGKEESEQGKEITKILHENRIDIQLSAAIVGNLALRADRSLSGNYVEYSQPEVAAYCHLDPKAKL